MKKITVKQISAAAIFSALAIILDVVSIKTDSSKITIYGLPLLFSGIIFGPTVGLLTGVVSGFISQVLTYGITPTTPLWVVAPALWGFISGLLSRKLFKKKESLKDLSLTVILTSILVTLVNTLALYLDGLIYQYPTEYVFTQLGIRILTSLLLSVVYTYLIYNIYPKIKSIVKL